MANFENIIPFILHFAAGVEARYLTQPLHRQFELARLTGWSDDPDDPGGATMIDITLKTYSSYRRKQGIQHTTKSQLRAITFEEWKDILKTLFWNAWRADEIDSPGIAHILVDWLWASGPKSIRVAQRIIGVKADGVVGPITLKGINCRDASMLFKELYVARKEYYRNCNGAGKYLRGWLRRLDAIRSDGTFRYC